MRAVCKDILIVCSYIHIHTRNEAANGQVRLKSRARHIHIYAQHTTWMHLSVVHIIQQLHWPLGSIGMQGGVLTPVTGSFAPSIYKRARPRRPGSTLRGPGVNEATHTHHTSLSLCIYNINSKGSSARVPNIDLSSFAFCCVYYLHTTTRQRWKCARAIYAIQLWYAIEYRRLKHRRLY